MAIEIVDLPIKNCVFPVRYVNVYQRVNSHLVRRFSNQRRLTPEGIPSLTIISHHNYTIINHESPLFGTSA